MHLGLDPQEGRDRDYRVAARLERKASQDGIEVKQRYQDADKLGDITEIFGKADTL